MKHPSTRPLIRFRSASALFAAVLAAGVCAGAGAGESPALAAAPAAESPAARDTRQLWEAERTWVRCLETNGSCGAIPRCVCSKIGAATEYAM